jgi:PAS domain S-box-containing protein
MPDDEIVRAQQQALARERELLRITLASIGDAVISTDVRGVVTFLNGVAESLTGWTHADAVGRPLTEIFHIVHEHTRRPAENPALRALQDGVIVGLANHTLLIARDGRERPIDDSAAPIRDDSGAAVGAVLVFRDVSERKLADEARAHLAAIVESSEDAIVSKGLDGVIRTWNASAARLFGYTPAEAVGRHITLIIPPERHAEEAAIVERLLHGERVESFETVRVARDGRRLDISLTVSPLRDSAGAIIGASKVARDITGRKRAADALRASEGRHRFLADLAAATQSLSDAAEVMAVTARMLAEHLDVDRCAYAEIEDQSLYAITGDHTRGVPSIVGRWPIVGFGHEHLRSMLDDQPWVVDDVETDPRAGTDLASYRATNIQAVICVPLHKAGVLTAAMAVHQKVARRWTEAEVTLVETVVDRCWEALERSRVARTLRESEARYRAIVEATPECVKLVDADGTLLQMNRAGLAMIEATHEWLAPGRSVFSLIAPEHLARYRELHARVCDGEGGTLEFDVIGRHGARRHMETTAVPLPAPDGRYHHLAVTHPRRHRARRGRAGPRREPRPPRLRGAPVGARLLVLRPAVRRADVGPAGQGALLAAARRPRHDRRVLRADAPRRPRADPAGDRDGDRRAHALRHRLPIGRAGHRRDQVAAGARRRQLCPRRHAGPLRRRHGRRHGPQARRATTRRRARARARAEPPAAAHRRRLAGDPRGRLARQHPARRRRGGAPQPRRRAGAVEPDQR